MNVATNVIIASITHASGSTVIVKFTVRLPAANHVIGFEPKREVGPSCIRINRMMASTAAVPQQRISGRWAARLSESFPLSKKVTTAAASGRARIASARPIGSDTDGLLGGRGGLSAGGGQRR